MFAAPADRSRSARVPSWSTPVRSCAPALSTSRPRRCWAASDRRASRRAGQMRRALRTLRAIRLDPITDSIAFEQIVVACESNRLVEGRACHADRVGRNRGSPGVEGLHGRLEARLALVAFFASEQAGRRDSHFFERKGCRLVGLEAHLLFDLEATESRRIPLDEERTLCGASLARGRRSPERGSNRRARRTDETLGSVEDPAVSRPFARECGSRRRPIQRLARSWRSRPNGVCRVRGTGRDTSLSAHLFPFPVRCSRVVLGRAWR